jgi:hypothetical protein
VAAATLLLLDQCTPQFITATALNPGHLARTLLAAGWFLKKVNNEQAAQKRILV